MNVTWSCQQASDANWLRAHAWHVTNYFLRFSKYFSAFHVDFWIANYFLSREKFICGSNNFIKICNRFLDLKNFPTRIFKKYWDLKYFFGFKNYFWSVPFRLPYGSESVASEYLQAMTSCHEQSLLLTVREAFLSQYLTLRALLGKCDLLTERLVKGVKFVVKSTGKYM